MRAKADEKLALSVAITDLKRRCPAALRVLRRALVRLWGRDVMLYVGGVSFFALLAIFPALGLLVGLYGILSTPEQVAAQFSAIADMLPEDAQILFQDELTRLIHASRPALSVQSAFALVIAIYAAHRGFKALLAGLSFIHAEDKPLGFVGFNLLALVVAIVAFFLLTLVSQALVVVRTVTAALHLPSLGSSWLNNEWTWSTAGLIVSFTLLYRYAMSSEPVGWRASAIGGVTAAVMSVAASAASAFYVSQVAHLGATYGSIGAVVVFLIWVSWNVNAVFFGGALATETELALKQPGLALGGRRA
jgi:membrane protein